MFETATEFRDRLAKGRQDNAEYLRIILGNPSWYESNGTMHTVACILDEYGTFADRTTVIRFFEKPWLFEQTMRTLAETLENG